MFDHPRLGRIEVTSAVVAARQGGTDQPGSTGVRLRLNRDKVAHLPAYLERNMVAPRHWNPPGA